MSRTIDEKVVSMQFDNRHFEKNVSTTMSTLDKLKQKLNFSDATKGFESIDSAAKKVDVSHLGNAVQTVSAKFSALQVVGVTALANITNSAIESGKKLVSSLSIDQITAGWSKYEQKTSSIQTIMNATGKSIDEVNQYLNKLMWFSDETSYSFTDMTAGLATMVSSGGDINKLIPLITGVANATAFAGKGAAEFSRVLQYGINQAYSLGYMQVMDWKTIEGATVNSKQLMETLIASAEAMGKIEKGAVTVQSFRSSLADKWLDKEVMEEGFGRFAKLSEAAYEAVAAGQYDTASEAIEALADKYDEVAVKAFKSAQEAKTFTEAIDATKDAVSSGWMKSFELIFGNYESAKVMWTDLANTLWDMFASGAEARNEWLGQALDSNWDKFSNKLSEVGLSVKDFEESLNGLSGDDADLSSIIKDYGSLDKAIKDGAISSKILKKALDETIKTGGKDQFASWVEGLDQIDEVFYRHARGENVKAVQTALKELGYDLSQFGVDGKFEYETANALMAFQKDKGLKVDGIVGPETLAALKEAGTTVSEITGDVDELKSTCDDLLDVITKKGGRELLLESLLNIVTAIQKPLEIMGDTLKEVFAISPKQLYNGLEKFNKFTNKLVMRGVLDVDSWDELTAKIESLGIDIGDFEEKLKATLGEHGIDVDKLIDKYGSFSDAVEAGAVTFEHIREALLGFDGVTDTLLDYGETADKLRRTFKGLLDILKLVANFTGGAFQFAFRVFKTILGRLDMDVLDFAANVGDALSEISDFANGLIDSGFAAAFEWLEPKIVSAIEKIREWIDALKDTTIVQSFAAALEDIPSTIEKVTSVISDCIAKVKETEIFKTVSGWISGAEQTISDALSGIVTAANEFNLSSVGQQLRTFGGWLSGLASSISNTKTFTTIVDAISTAFTKLDDTLSGFGGFGGSSPTLGNLKTFANEARKIEAKGVGSLGEFLKSFASVRFDAFKWTWDDAKTKLIQKFTNFWAENSAKIEAAFEKAAAAWTSIKKFIFGTEDVDLPTILGITEKILSLAVLVAALETLQSFTAPFDGIADGFNNLAQAVKWKAIGGAFVSMSIALVALTGCIVVLTSITDADKAITAAKMLGQLLLVMAGIIAGLAIVTKFTGGLDVTASIGALLMTVASLVLLIKVIEKLDTSRLRDPIGTFVEVFAMLMVLALGVKMVAKAGSASFGSIAAILTMITALDQILGIIKKYDEYPWEGMEDGIRRMIDMLLVLAVAIRIASGGVKAGAGVGGLAFTLIAMLISLRMLLGLIEDYGEAAANPAFEAGKKAVFELLGFMTLMSFVLGKTGRVITKKDEKLANNFAGLALALLVVVGAIYLLGKMAIDHHDILVKGGNAVGQVLLLLAGVFGTIGLACRGVNLGATVALLAGIGIIIAELWYIIKDMQSMSLTGAMSSAGALSLVLLSLAGVFTAIGKIKGGWKKGSMLIAMMVVLGGVIAVLGWVLKQMKDINPAASIGNAVALSVLLGAISGVMYAIGGLDTRQFSDAKMKKVYKMFFNLTVVLALLAAVLWGMSRLGGTNNAIQNAIGVSTLLGAMTGVLYALGNLDMKHFSDAKMKKIYTIFANFAVVLAMLAVVLAIMSTLKTENAISNAVALTVLLTAMTHAISVLSDTKAMSWKKMGTVLISMATLTLVLYAISGVLWILNNLNVGNALANVVSLSVLLIAMSKVVGIISESSDMSWKKMGTVLISMTVLSAVLYAISGVLWILNGINATKAIGNAMSLSVLLLAMSGVVKILSNSKAMSWKKMGTILISMTALSAILYTISGVLWILNGIDAGKAIRNVVALSAMLMVLTGAMSILSNSKAMSWKKMGTVLISMTALSAVLYAISGVLWILNGINTEKAIGNVAALSAMLIAMSTALVIISSSKAMSWEKMGTSLIAMTTLSLLLFVLADVIKQLDGIDPGRAIGNVTALSILLNAMAAAMLILSLVKTISAGAVIGMYALSGVVALLVPVMEKLQGIAIPINNVMAISALLNAMAAAMVILQFVKTVSPGAIIGMYALSGVVAILGLVFAKIMDMKCDKAMATAKAMSLMLITMTGIFTVLGFVGGLAPTAIMGAIGLVGVVAILGAAAAAIGEVMSWIPASTIDSWIVGFEQFMKFLTILMEGLGEMASGFIVGFTDGLAEAGENLATFANSLSGVNADAVNGAKAICEAVLALTGASFLEGITSWIFGEDSLSSFGEKIKNLAECIVSASSALADVSDADAENIKRGAEAAGPLVELSNAIPKKGGLWQDIFGEADLDSWGASIVAFAEHLIAYSETVTGKSIDAAAIKNSATAGGYVAELNDKVPKSGGLWQDIAGEADIASWGEKIVAFGKSLVAYSEVLAGGTINATAIQNSATAAGHLADLNSQLTANEGVWQKLAGSKDLATFGESLVGFGEGLLAFSNVAIQIDDAKIAAIEKSVEAVEAIKSVMAAIPDEGGWFTKLFKSNDSGDATSFGGALSELATGIGKYCTTISNIKDTTAIEESKTMVEKIGEVLEVAPGPETTAKASYLNAAMNEFRNAATTITQIGLVDYSGINLDGLKTNVKTLLGIVEGDTDFGAIGTKFYNLSVSITNAVACSDKLTQLNGKTYDGISTLKAAVSALSNVDVQGVIDAFSGKAEQLATTVTGITKALGAGLSDGAGDVKNALTSVLDKAIAAMLSTESINFKAAGTTLGECLASGVDAAKDTIIAAGETAGTDATSGARSVYDGMITAGAYLGDGIVVGLKDPTLKSRVYDAGYALGLLAQRGFEDANEIQSPSKVMIRDGKFIGEGAIIGIKSMGRAVYNAGKTMGKEALDGVSRSIARVADIVSSDIDAQPTIRPVLDLSDIRAGAGAISGLLEANPVGVMTNIGSISTMMNRRSQNGAESEVVSAINKLRKELGSVGNTTYSINGITYDDGSNVATAVKEIVRAARNERRV